ncbi:hypothetical protein GY45DRAFT_1331520 [Cubamyces sp. BRFM 1775]|nr:hypothetical protein GY45DRAFT_1331520 [Cubamyces sp. BRFM 1775]
MSHLKQRLLDIEDDFLSALAEGEDALLSFESRWEALYNDIDVAVESSSVDQDTLSLAHATALRCATLADLSVETFTSCSTIEEELMGELEELISELHLYQDPEQTSSARSASQSTSLNQGTRKRGRSSIGEEEHSIGPSCKRIRSRSPPKPLPRRSLARMSQLSSPSPLPSSLPIPNSTTSLSPGRGGCPTKTSAKRKRCASDADLSWEDSPTKRRYAGPRLHAVSDSFIPSHPHKPTAPVPSSHHADDTSPLENAEHPVCDHEDIIYTPWTNVNVNRNSSHDVASLTELNELDRFLSSLLDPVHSDCGDGSSSPLYTGSSIASWIHSQPSNPTSLDHPEEGSDQGTDQTPSPTSTTSSLITPPNQSLELSVSPDWGGEDYIDHPVVTITASCDLLPSTQVAPLKKSQHTTLSRPMESHLDDYWLSFNSTPNWLVATPPYCDFTLPAFNYEDSGSVASSLPALAETLESRPSRVISSTSEWSGDTLLTVDIFSDVVH